MMSPVFLSSLCHLSSIQKKKKLHSNRKQTAALEGGGGGFARHRRGDATPKPSYSDRITLARPTTSIMKRPSAKTPFITMTSRTCHATSSENGVVRRTEGGGAVRRRRSITRRTRHATPSENGVVRRTEGKGRGATTPFHHAPHPACDAIGKRCRQKNGREGARCDDAVPSRPDHEPRVAAARDVR